MALESPSNTLRFSSKVQNKRRPEYIKLAHRALDDKIVYHASHKRALRYDGI